jgi:hypothetical protein
MTPGHCNKIKGLSGCRLGQIPGQKTQTRQGHLFRTVQTAHTRDMILGLLFRTEQTKIAEHKSCNVQAFLERP